MSRTGPAHYHQGSPNICHCAYSDVYHHTSAPYVYPQRPRAVPGHPSDYAPAVRRVPKPKPTTKLAKSRDLKFDEDGWQWYFETKEAPGVRWRETVWNVEDLPQAKDADYHAMVYEYYMAGHVVDEPDRDKLPVMPGGLGKKWRYKRAPPPSAPRTPEDYSPRQEYSSPPQPYTPPPQQYASPSQGYSSPQYAYAEPLYQRHPAAPTYASGSAHPVSMRLPPGADGWRTYSNELPPPPALSSPHESYSRTLGPLPGAPGPRRFVDASLPGGHPYDPQQGYQDEDSYDEDEDRSESEYEPRERAYIPPPSPKSRRRAQKLRERGFRVVDPHNNAELDALEAQARHARSSSVPNLAVSAKIEIHRLLQPRTTLGLTRMPDLVFDLRYDPRHAFDRTQNDGKPDLMNAPAFQPGQEFVRLVIRHPFNGRVGEWVQDMGEARYMTVMDVLMVISDMIHANIDQTHDWEPLSEFDKSFVYEAYLNRPCPDEDATGKRLHLFCEKYMFGGMEQLPPKAKGTTAQGPSFLVKLIKNSKHKRYDKIVGFRTPSSKSRAASGHSRSKSSSGVTFPYLASDGESSRRTEG